MGILESLSETVAYRKQRSHRIETLADGVFAIVMTLLVLDIRVPLNQVNTENDVWSSISHTVPKILTFILSFSAAGQSWSVFTNHFNYIHRTDRNENVITLLYLMFVSLLPFSTSFLSEHLWSRVAMGFYILNILLILLFNTLHWSYAYRIGLVRVEEDSCVVIHKAIMRRVRAKFMAYIVVVGCCLFSSYLALAGIIIIQIIFTFSGLIEMLYCIRIKKANVASQSLMKLATESAQETMESKDCDNEHDDQPKK